METPEGSTIEKWLRENKLLNMDVDLMFSRGTLLFLQFSNLMTKVSDIECRLIKVKQMLENNTRLLRDIKRSTAV